jgi:copper transport protein
VAVLLPSTTLHVVAMTVWVGGLASLLLALPAATRRLEATADRSRLLAETLMRFAPLALVAVAALLASGVLQSILYLDSLGELLDTGFGRAIVVKAVLLLALVALGAFQRRRSLPRLRRIAADGGTPGAAGIALRRALRIELLLVVAVLVATAFLAALSPASTTAGGPFDETTAIGPLQLQLTVDPAAAGSNAVHLYLIDPRDGSQFRGAREVTISATERDRSIGPIEERPDLAGPGHYTLSAMSFGVAGTWQLRIDVRISDFDQYETTVEVPIR